MGCHTEPQEDGEVTTYVNRFTIIDRDGSVVWQFLGNVEEHDEVELNLASHELLACINVRTAERRECSEISFDIFDEQKLERLKKREAISLSFIR